MPPAKRSGSRKKSTTRSAAKEPSALRKLNKSLDSAQDALAALSKEVGKDVGGGARDLHKNLQGFIRTHAATAQARNGPSARPRAATDADGELFNAGAHPGGRTKGVRTLQLKEGDSPTQVGIPVR
jgi:hypothetical protein